jgi:hypothetical protein
MWRRDYWQVILYDADGIVHHHMVHTLVARAHIGQRPAGMECRHGPEGSLVNRVDNLCYGTPMENAADKVRDGTANRGSRNPMAKLTEEMVSEIRRRRAAGVQQKTLAGDFSVSRATISMVVNGKRWMHDEDD